MRRRGSGDVGGRLRGFVWIPRGPLGISLFIVLVAALLMLVVAASAVLLIAAVAVGLALAVVQSGRGLLSGGRAGRGGRGREIRMPEIDGRFLDRGVAPLDRYLTLVEEFDHLSSTACALDLANASSWRGGRKVTKALGRAALLREHVIAVERELSAQAGAGADAARPGLWELVVASTELLRFLQDVLEYPAGRGRGAQMRELAALIERRAEIERRRDALIRRLQQTDLRVPRAVGG